MNRAELLAAMRATRAQLDAALAGMSPEQLTLPGAVGEWSVKDVLAHLTACEVELLTNLFKAQRRQKPGKMDLSDAEVEAQNQKWYREYQDRPLQSVLADFEGVHRQGLRVVEGLSEAALAEPAPWDRGKSLGYYFQDWIVDHEAEHLPELLAWRKAQTHGANGAG
jgi:hypothetical protein